MDCTSYCTTWGWIPASPDLPGAPYVTFKPHRDHPAARGLILQKQSTRWALLDGDAEIAKGVGEHPKVEQAIRMRHASQLAK